MYSYQTGFAPRDFVPQYPELWNGCVGAWAPCLGPTGATLRDWSGFQNHGALTMPAGVGWAVNGGRYALTHDGIDDAAIVASNTATPTGGNPRTLAIWFNQTTRTSNSALVAIGNWNLGQVFCVQLFLSAGDVYLFTDGLNGGNNITLTGAEIPELGVWNHLAFTFATGGAWSYYLNGRVVKSGTFPTTINTGSSTIQIGHRDGYSYFHGRTDDVRSYNRALRANEIALIYNLGRGGPFTPRQRTSVRIASGNRRRRLFFTGAA